MLIQNLDMWDRYMFIDQMESNQDLKDAELLGSERVSNFSEFMIDIFGGLYKYAPEVRDKSKAPPNSQWTDHIYEEISKLQEWKTLRERTIMHPEAAGAATAKFCMDFIDAIPKKKPPKKNNLNPKYNLPLDYISPISPTKYFAMEMDQAVQGTLDSSGPKDDINIHPQKLDISTVRRVAREACKVAAQIADETIEAIEAFGYGNGSGNPQYASPQKKKEIAARLNDNEHLKKIALMAGRFRRIATNKQKTKTRHGVDEMADIEIGDDLARLVPTEISKLAHPLMKLDFQKKFLEKNLVQYRLRGRAKMGKGPLVVCVDESGSMKGERDIWAKAVAMALLQIAQKQKRNYALIHFDGIVTRVDRFEGPVNPIAILDAIAHFSGGGTNFEHPISRAVSIISEDNNYKNADIIFITDGNSKISNDWLNFFLEGKKKGEFNVTSIIISAEAPECEKFSDNVVRIKDVIDSDAALDAIFTV